jgi:hypothetical protein
MHMKKTTRFGSLLLLFTSITYCGCFAQSAAGPAWQSLFNGKDLSGWQTYLRPSAAAGDQTPIGLNQDPHGVFKVEKGLLRISGQDWGGLFTEQSFSNYHLRLQVKFGSKKWPPRENVVADGGLLFHCSPPYDFGSTCWMRSIELQIQEGDIGDYHNVGAGISWLPFSPGQDEGDSVDQYNPYAPLQQTTSRVFRSANFESAPGEWTTCELIARGADAVFIVNGFVVNRLYNIYRTDLQQQTSSGQIQFQSEGAEHYLKTIQWRPLDFTHSAPAQLVSQQAPLQVTDKTTQTLVIENKGTVIEIIACELLGKNTDQFIVQLPAFPLVLKQGEKLSLPVSVRPGSSHNKVKLRLETVLGPVAGFEATLQKL